MADFGTTDISSTLDIQRKPKGRPPGSKNKLKPPIIITKDLDSSMNLAILHISIGYDIIGSIIEFTINNHVGVTILSATGLVCDVSLCHPSLSLAGPFSMLALSGSFIRSAGCSFGITLAGTQGEVFGGIVAGKVVAASEVTVVAATFIKPIVHKVPQEDRSRGNMINDDVDFHISHNTMHNNPPHFH